MNNPFDLEGKVALVTGASTGIGAGIACALAQAGADVAAHGNSQSPESTCARIEELGRRAVPLRADVSSRDAVLGLASNALDAFGKVDILVNNAGTIRRAAAVEYSEEDWAAVMGVNASGVFWACQELGRHMLERGGGKIINVASLLSFQGGIRVPAYSASKGAVAQLTKALANEWAERGVNVNAIAPGYIRTNNTLALQRDSTRNRQIVERIPAGRWGEPSDLGGAAVFLGSSASDYVHGHVLVVDGGWMGR